MSPLMELARPERERFLEAVSAAGLPPAFANAAELEQYLLGPAFEQGRTYLTLWEGDTLAGALGVVVREIAAKGEVFLTLLYVLAADADAVLGRLLREAYAVIGRCEGASGETVVKVGVGTKHAHLMAPLERAGCRIAYRILDMVRPLEGALSAPTAALQFEPLTMDNLADFRTIHNTAFLLSPNGAQVTLEEVAGMCREARSAQFLQVGYAGGEPAALLAVDVRGDVGQIDIVAVAPPFQGQGLGRATVASTLAVLEEAGAREAHLQVVEVNRQAVALYQACGFVTDRVVSTWFYGPAPGNS